MIPTYSFDGARLRDHSIQTVLWLESVDSIRVRRKQGRIVSIRFRATAVKIYSPSQGDGLSRCRHTRIEQVGNRRIVQHKPLPYRALSGHLDQREREAIMRAAYSGVQLSCMERM